MTTLSVAIIGGGISGMYIADALLSKGLNVSLFEKQNTLGGRVHTVSINDKETIEIGAGRFNERHKHLLKLIRNCGLQDKISPISNNQRSYHIGKTITFANYKKYVTEYLFGSIVNSASKYTKTQLLSMTMHDMLYKEYPDYIVRHIIGAFGYNSEFELQNAYTTLQILKKEFNDNIQYYYLQGGLSQIIHCLELQIVNKGGAIFKNTSVNQYDPVQNIITFHDKSLKFDKVIFCCTKKTLSQFSKLLEYDPKLNNYIETIQMAPLNRIFAVFPVNKNGVAWFHDIKRVTTNLPIRYIIPLNAQTGLIQISYTDNAFAKYWHRKSNYECKKEIVKYLKEMFPNKDIPYPTWLKSYYWEEGATYWKPFYRRYRNLKNNNYYIAGEMMSTTHSGWIEGALESGKNIVNLLTIH